MKMEITREQQRFILEAAIMSFLANNPLPYSPTEIGRALHTDYRQTLAACHRLHKAGKIRRVFFHGANLSAYWYENQLPF